MKKTLIVLCAIILFLPTGAVAGDLEDIVAAIEKRWADTAKNR